MARRDARERGDGAGTPLLEWVSAAFGLLVAAGMLGAIGWQALRAPEDAPPRLVVRAGSVARAEGGWTVRIVVENRSAATAANAVVEGALRAPGGLVERRRIVFDYVPGGSRRRGAFVFTLDPSRDALDLRATGWTDP